MQPLVARASSRSSESRSSAWARAARRALLRTVPAALRQFADLLRIDIH